MATDPKMGVEIIQRHYQDLKDFLYEPEPQIFEKSSNLEVK